MDRHEAEPSSENQNHRQQPPHPNSGDGNSDNHQGGGGGGFNGNINNYNYDNNHQISSKKRRFNHNYGGDGYRGAGVDEFQHSQHNYNGPPDGFSNKLPLQFPFPRKRRFSTSDCPEGGNYVKLFVGSVSRTATEDAVRDLFEEHGTVIEVVLVRDKITGHQQEFCFVKYASTEEADRAISALNKQYIFPGGAGPIRVKYADGEIERLAHPWARFRSTKDEHMFANPYQRHIKTRTSSTEGPINTSSSSNHSETVAAPQRKVYVNGLNKQASEEEITEVFSPFGVVEDVYILLDDFKQRRGCGFVGFSNRDMALAAINGLNGTYVMKGCDRALTVRFADPKKPRPSHAFREDDGISMPNALHAGNSYAPVHENAADRHAEAATPFLPASHRQPVSPVNPPQMPSSQSPGTVSKPEIALRTSAESNAAMISCECVSPEDYPECEWSEHFCPEGNKYYYNCITYESRWEKPEEFAIYEQEQLSKQQQLRNSSVQQSQPISTSEASGGPISLTEELQHRSQSPQLKNEELLNPVSCAVEHGQEKLCPDTSPIGAPESAQQGLSAM